MKARIPVGKRLSKEARESMRERIREELIAEHQAGADEATRQTIKLMLLVLHQEFGFGENRLKAVMNAYGDLLLDCAQDELFWWHVDGEIIKRLGFPFAKEDYDRFEENHHDIAREVRKAMK